MMDLLIIILKKRYRKGSKFGFGNLKRINAFPSPIKNTNRKVAVIWKIKQRQ